MLNINFQDITQIVIGAFALAVPLCFSEEVWRLGATLPLTNIILVASLSIVFLAFFTYENIFQGNVKLRILAFVFRIFFAYSLTIIVSALLLLSLDKLPLMYEPLVAFKRVVLVSLPASMGAIVVDSFDKE
ncbi:MAG: DUF2391 family protein [Gammaproteobacteria bacterium]|nr:DUF2391 family protein [Gammaproteobacteria bacterium]